MRMAAKRTIAHDRYERRRRAIIPLLILPVAIALAGCSGSGGANGITASLGMSSTFEQTKGKFKTAAVSKMESHAKRRPQSASNTVLSFNGEPGHLTAMEAAQDLGIIRHRRAEAYMQRILSQLAAQWPYEAPKVGVFVRAQRSLNASATATDILVPIGVLETVESEDQLAAILAHELSHILLRHHEQIDQKRALTKGVSTAGSLAVAMAFSSEIETRRMGNQVQVGVRDPQAAQNKALYAAAAQLTLQTLVNDVAGPGWSRVHENEADLLAVDLLESAGYDGRAMIEVLRKLAVAQEKKERTAEEYAKRNAALMEEARKSLQSSGLAGAAQTIALSAMSDALTSVGERLRRSHPDAGERRKDVQGYLNREYADALHEPKTASHAAEWRQIKPLSDAYVPVFTANNLYDEQKFDEAQAAINRALAGPVRDTPTTRYVAYRIALMTNNKELAYRHLLAIRSWSDAPVGAYAALAHHHAMRGRIAEGETVLGWAEKRFQSADIMRPSRVAMYRASGRTKEAELSLAECNKSTDDDVRSSCDRAFKTAVRSTDVTVASKDDNASTWFNPSGAFLSSIAPKLPGM